MSDKWSRPPCTACMSVCSQCEDVIRGPAVATIARVREYCEEGIAFINSSRAMRELNGSQSRLEVIQAVLALLEGKK